MFVYDYKLYKVTYFGNAVNYESEQLFMCPMFVTECYHNKCLNCQPCVQFIFSPRSESDMILSVMTMAPNVGPHNYFLRKKN